MLERENPVDGLVTVISASATTAPELSVTVPCTPPRKVCAARDTANAKRRDTEASVLICECPECGFEPFWERIIPLCMSIKTKAGKHLAADERRSNADL